MKPCYPVIAIVKERLSPLVPDVCAKRYHTCCNICVTCYILGIKMENSHIQYLVV